MKKIIAIVMALVMMMAVAVPAFAAEIKKDDANQSGQATVATTTDATDATYTVTYPASTTIAWGDTTAVNVNYAVTSQLPIGASLKVSVAADNNGEMTSANAAGYKLTYTLTGGAEETFQEINNNVAPSTDVTVAIADFSQAVPDVYTGTLTYTVAYAAA